MVYTRSGIAENPGGLTRGSVVFGKIFLAVVGILLLLPGICGIGALALIGPEQIVLVFAIPGIVVGMIGVVVFGAAFERFGSRKPSGRGGRKR